MSFLYLFFSVVVCLVVYGGRVDVGNLGSEGASSSSLLVLKPKLFSLTIDAIARINHRKYFG